MVPAQGDVIELSTRIYLDHPQLCSVSGRKLESGEESGLAIGCSLHKQETFGMLVCSFDAVSEYSINRVLVVPMGCLPAMGSVETGGAMRYGWGYG